MFKPHQLASLEVEVSTRRRIVEIISFMFNNEIMVRMVPGEPTTITKAYVADLLPYQRKRYCHIAEVTTNLCFPQDMLRYDNASFYYHDKPDNPKLNEYLRGKSVLVYTVSDKKKSPWTIGRWKSFSCSLQPIKVIDLKCI